MPLDEVAEPSGRAFDSSLTTALASVRTRSLAIAAPLSAEDQAVQAHPDASPTKWHLAHTTWFFEEFVLKPHLTGFSPFDARFSFCFNSYYDSVGPHHPRPKRGLLTRPSLEEVLSYRAHVDEALGELLLGEQPEVSRLVEIGLHHEQQHQELMLTDILALFAENPLKPAYREGEKPPACAFDAAMSWSSFSGGIYMVGHEGGSFAYDNEGPAHQVLLRDFRLCDRLVTNADWLAFIDDGGYETAGVWLSDGWALAQREGWRAPLYWERGKDGTFRQMTLHGLKDIDPAAPVCHVSYYEADAFARWAGYRLPTEYEWEVAAKAKPLQRSPVDLRRLTPKACEPEPLAGLYDELWQWTQSPYAAYPGYRPPPPPLGEYNGKFMCNQFVLRGGSFATPEGHLRKTYRNFFFPHQRWQFMGVRLASEAP